MDIEAKNSEDSAIYNMLFCFFSLHCEICNTDFEINNYDIKTGDVNSWAIEQSKNAKSAGWSENKNEIVCCPLCAKI